MAGAEARDDSATGQLVLEGRTGELASEDGIRIWSGRIADSFYIDLSLLVIVNRAVKNRTAVDLSAWRPEDAKNSFANTTVDMIVLEVSHEHPQLRPGARIELSGRHETRHGRRRLAADQPRRAAHDLADLLARRHPLYKSRQHKAPVRRLLMRKGCTSLSTLPLSSRPAGPQTTPRARARLCRELPLVTAGRWPTTHPK